MVNRRPGFTLIEMVIVFVIMSLMAGSLFVLMRNNRNTVADISQTGVWQSQAVAVFNRIGADARHAGNVSWTDGSLLIADSVGEIVYRLDESENRNLVREHGEALDVLARDVVLEHVARAHESLGEPVEGALVRVHLVFFRWNGSFQSRSEHATSIVIPQYTANRDAP